MEPSLQWAACWRATAPFRGVQQGSGWVLPSTEQQTHFLLGAAQPGHSRTCALSHPHRRVALPGCEQLPTMLKNRVSCEA